MKRQLFKLGFRLFGEQRGTAIILVALMMTVLVGMGALVIDVGLMYNSYSDLRNAVDAAALAGAQQLPDTAAAYDTALEYALANGLTESEVVIVVPYEGDNGRIQVSSRRQINFSLAPLLGFSSDTLSTRAVATCSGGRAFDYAIFSGSQDVPLTLNGSSLYVEGSVHGNEDVKLNGSSQTISGALEAVDKLTVNGSSQSIGERIAGAAVVPTPVWSMSDLKARAAAVYKGDQSFNGPELNINGDIFVEGNIVLSAAKISGVGSITATGSITINGSGMTYKTAADAVCFYAGKDIGINGSNAKFEGILYAPSGQIMLNGSNQTIIGAIIGNQVMMNGSSQTVKHDAQALQAVPFRTAKLTI